MSTGWRWIRDDGEVFKSQMQAAASMRERPGSTFEFSELTMAGERRTDVTEQLRGFAERTAPPEAQLGDVPSHVEAPGTGGAA